jgi:2-polyprenyl-6-methoxyphenol hydroxylase-like FAD-dependent oxidoreductase
MPEYDVVTIGGGLAGAALARSIAEQGIRVLVLEQTREFTDRVRGENLQPWGAAEARALGIYDLLLKTCGHEQPWIELFLGPIQMMHRDCRLTTPQAVPIFNFNHPAMQETLLGTVAQAGAEVRRSVTVKEIRPGGTPTVLVQQDGVVQEISARLVVGADGRSSMARRTFQVQQDAPFLVIAGILFDHMRIPEDTGFVYLNPQCSYCAYLFPQGDGRVRAYAAWPVAEGVRLQGERDLPQFIERSLQAGVPPSAFDGVVPSGPLATFDAADTWVEHPYANGVVLIGDAASSADPSWGQGLSITLRDVRVLRDCLLKSDDWESACHDYAAEHDRHYGVIHEVTHALKDMFVRSGPEADTRRARALPLIGADPMRMPDHVLGGPDLPWSDAVRRTFFADEAAAESV